MHESTTTLIISAPPGYQDLLFRLCSQSISRMSQGGPACAVELRDIGLRSMLRISARRLLEAPVFAREGSRVLELGAANATAASDLPVRRKREARSWGASIDWSEVGYDPRYRGIERLGQQDELRFVALSKAGDSFARQKLTLHYLPLLRSVALLYRGHGLSTSELVNEGTFGLSRAIDRFDVGRHLRFGTYAKWWIRDAIERALATQGRLVRLPVNVLRSRRKEALAQQREDNNTSMRVHAVEREATEESHGDGSDTGLVQREDDQDAELGVDEATPEMLVGEKQQRRLLSQALHRLSDREREVLIRRFGLNGNEPRTLTTTAEELKLSHERVRQIQNCALVKLRALLDTSR
jgi:RNA polymerase nonessential primary-like sigma factor